MEAAVFACDDGRYTEQRIQLHLQKYLLSGKVYDTECIPRFKKVCSLYCRETCPVDTPDFVQHLVKKTQERRQVMREAKQLAKERQERASQRMV